MGKIISIMGPHAGESAGEIFSRKIQDIENTGMTFWVINSYKSQPKQLQNFCGDESFEVYFVSPSTVGGAKDTKTEIKNNEFSIDKTSWTNIPENISPVTGKGYALVLSSLKIINKNVDLNVDLNDYAEEDHSPLKFSQGCSTICCIKEDMSEHPNKVKSNLRNIWAVGKLRFPYCVWVR